MGLFLNKLQFQSQLRFERVCVHINIHILYIFRLRLKRARMVNQISSLQLAIFGLISLYKYFVSKDVYVGYIHIVPDFLLFCLTKLNNMFFFNWGVPQFTHTFQSSDCRMNVIVFYQKRKKLRF